jgi:hypothetical protein
MMWLFVHQVAMAKDFLAGEANDAKNPERGKHDFCTSKVGLIHLRLPENASPRLYPPSPWHR